MCKQWPCKRAAIADNTKRTKCSSGFLVSRWKQSLSIFCVDSTLGGTELHYACWSHSSLPSFNGSILVSHSKAPVQWGLLSVWHQGFTFPVKKLTGAVPSANLTVDHLALTPAEPCWAWNPRRLLVLCLLSLFMWCAEFWTDQLKQQRKGCAVWGFQQPRGIQY